MLFWHLGMTAAIVFLTLGRRRVDYRVALLGGILPDLIDKPVGRIFFADQFETSRLVGHTFLFAVGLLLLVMILPGRDLRWTWFILPITVMIHLALDAMWNDPVTLFWPLFGTEFPKHPATNYWLEVLRRPLDHPAELIKEMAGLIALAYLFAAHKLREPERRRRFLRTGTL